MRNKLLAVLFIVLLGGVMSMMFSQNLFILTIVGVLIYLAIVNNKDRKENLNVIKDESRLYFYLSDDLLFSVDLPKNKNLTQTIRESLKNEMTTLKDITRKICFINFKDDKLLVELNSKLNNSQ